MSVIKIGVACHKPSVLPKNPIFMPIQVGSAIATNRMENMEHDDTGDNISNKNGSYCELTAQYWLWKNQEADYYGLCHYRRFLCFADVKDAKTNERKMYDAYTMDEYNFKRFGLENDQEMRSIIEENDLVVGKLQTVADLYSPRGNKKTALEHWVAHDRALINVKDLEKMLEILNKVSPEVGKDAKEYLNGTEFLGFNCFIMKKEFFNELCNIEFTVLKELEQYVDATNYCQQLSRVYGFMGEIICSSYIYHLEKQNKYKVKHVPLVYFNYTDKELQFEPIKDAIPVLFINDENEPILFGTIWQSFLDNVDKEHTYDVLTCFNNIKPSIKSTFVKMAKEYENVHIRFIDGNHYFNIANDHNKEIKHLLPYMPWILKQYKKMLVFGQDIIFKQSIVELWNSKLNDSEIVAAPYDILTQAQYNDIYEETAAKYLSKQMKDPYNYFNSSMMLLDFDKYRLLSQKDIYKLTTNEYYEFRNANEIMNIILEGKCKYIDQKWSVWYNDTEYLKYQLPYAPFDKYSTLLKAQKDPAIITYQPFDNVVALGNKVDLEFWEIAKRTPLYGQYVCYMAEFVKRNNPKKDVLNKYFPKGNKMRNQLSFIFPKGSKRNMAVKKVLGKFGMK